MKIFSELGFSLQVASVAAAEVGQVGQALAKAAEKTEEALSSEAGARMGDGGWLRWKNGNFFVDLSL